MRLILRTTSRRVRRCALSENIPEAEMKLARFTCKARSGDKPRNCAHRGGLDEWTTFSVQAGRPSGQVSAAESQLHGYVSTSMSISYASDSSWQRLAAIDPTEQILRPSEFGQQGQKSLPLGRWNEGARATTRYS